MVRPAPYFKTCPCPSVASTSSPPICTRSSPFQPPLLHPTSCLSVSDNPLLLSQTPPIYYETLSRSLNRSFPKPPAPPPPCRDERQQVGQTTADEETT
ncbi:hypothetical protein CABS02_04504 [Colletotrichum abscissum]|uniref:Uncharacterized protein n=1 Tax=Colletotrichum abscissum TaxID=1671311 RepID=A0A9P9XKA8_9PEZI|nr:hypothetical protein CABS02_04504 [Colletotrichum abscissum]